MSEPITNVEDAVAALGALPVPVGPESQASERDRLRVAFVKALENAHRTHPCPVLGDQTWSGCVHYDEAGRVAGVGSCHEERRADAVLAVRDAEVDRLSAQVAALLEERHSTNESLDEAIQALRGYEQQALPWVHAMSDDDLHGFLDSLVSAALNRWRSEPEVPDRVTLAEIEKACAEWRTPGQGYRSDEDEPAPKCRCSEPDADPYACEADDCTHEFSELNPFGGGSGPVEGHDAKVSRTCGCGFRTTVWHVGDGSAEAELHGHVVRVHGGVYPAESGGAS